MTSPRFVRQPRSLWTAYRLGRDHHVRPSALYDVRPRLTALYFDRAVDLFGRSLENRIRVVSEGQKSQKAAETRAMRELERWLASADPVDEQKTVGRFRDPFAEGLVG